MRLHLPRQGAAIARTAGDTLIPTVVAAAAAAEATGGIQPQDTYVSSACLQRKSTWATADSCSCTSVHAYAPRRLSERLCRRCRRRPPHRVASKINPAGGPSGRLRRHGQVPNRGSKRLHQHQSGAFSKSLLLTLGCLRVVIWTIFREACVRYTRHVYAGRPKGYMPPRAGRTGAQGKLDAADPGRIRPRLDRPTLTKGRCGGR